MFATDWLSANWPAPAHVRTLVTTRSGGVSVAPYTSFNLAAHVGDTPEHVAENREILRRFLPCEPAWLNQVHGTVVVDVASLGENPPEADASVAYQCGKASVVMTADCLPVLFCDRAGSVVASAHAGWRGLADGVLEATVAAMKVAPDEILAWMGPAIGPDAFEVGAEVRSVFLAHAGEADAAFKDIGDGKFLADIYLLARQRLAECGVTAVYGGDFCTVIDRDRFYSYRRDGVSGRMASLIWLECPEAASAQTS
ncbi:peptidoglycan editing factor PgeF [Craterilacuibacter sinensis]|uniref:Purine nucleoside phosphorylase n=1 Tax=Craterilacuibacter sinensis TaxID=2686017 RepID=A0A845BP64_9NEIS|nr:peptidoglycan editing factor PgeF [Craterilacuibacter sinensis]MXR36968.1 peptidoglycan editing factor PgeF [Craterilacuibacter sinensis]